MIDKPVLFIDSGIGGLPYCVDFHGKNPHETIIYLADTKNFPYGPRKKEEIASILITLTEKLLEKTDPKIIVLACNTATISALACLRERFPQVPFVGTVPAIKPAITSSKKKVGVLGTERTIEEIRSLNLVDDTREIFGAAAPELVEFIERRFDEANDKEKKEFVKKYIDIFRKEGVDSLVLGCTHFLVLLEEFRQEASTFGFSTTDVVPNIGVFDSLEGITKRIEFLLDENNGLRRAGKDSSPVHRILLTAEDSSVIYWQERARKLGFKLNLLSEL